MTARALRAVVVDDERLARVQLAQLLTLHPGLHLAGEASSGEEAIELIGRTKPEVIFLDVQMPRMSGFDVLRAIDAGPQVVFVTAYDRHAVRAFEVNALDFLLKPVTQERFARSVERLLTVQRPPPASSSAGLKLPNLEYPDRLFLTIHRHPQFVQLSDIACIRAADDYSEVFTRSGRSALVAQTLRHWEQRLPATHFIRIHRSALVNFAAITRIEAHEGGGCRVYVEGPAQPLTMSRRFADALRRRGQSLEGR